MIAGVGALADFISSQIARRQCQEIVDARGDEVKVSKNCDFHDGRILVIAKDGLKVDIHDVPANVNITAVLQAALKEGGSAVKAAAEAAGAKADEPQPA